ncbi:hypothetical protein F4819DRAFT_156892 [Hypoxylon fuscum]|nr:hypothetical protein F4819DRAFT_156892 [Hypoxylon fuscum]
MSESTGRTDEERWFDIWDILFPGSRRPDSPYISVTFGGLDLNLRDARDEYQRSGSFQQYVDRGIPFTLKEQSTQVENISWGVLGDFLVYFTRWMERHVHDDQGDNHGIVEDILSPINPNTPSNSSESHLQSNFLHTLPQSPPTASPNLSQSQVQDNTLPDTYSGASYPFSLNELSDDGSTFLENFEYWRSDTDII